MVVDNSLQSGVDRNYGHEHLENVFAPTASVASPETMGFLVETEEDSKTHQAWLDAMNEANRANHDALEVAQPMANYERRLTPEQQAHMDVGMVIKFSHEVASARYDALASVR